MNVEQQFSGNGPFYGRFGWNEGQHKSFAYTEVDQTFALGGDYALGELNRARGKVGLSLVSNAIRKITRSI